MQLTLKNFFVPYRFVKKSADISATSICAIVPSYKPEELTVSLVRDLINWNPSILVYVVDDCTPQNYLNEHNTFEEISTISDRVKVLRTPTNKLKAGAINFALSQIARDHIEKLPDVVITLDDDVVIEKNTIDNLVEELKSYDHLGAVCSQCRVLNKNKNLLTRLQGLEYFGFNATRLADEGFHYGPLVMHGMLTAFKMEALLKTGFFAEGHLIEDYEITTRLKRHGYHVKSAPRSFASTRVPETFTEFWKQRARWSYGGITVVTDVRNWGVVVQDTIGHFMFISTVILLNLLLIINTTQKVPSLVLSLIVIFSFAQCLIWYSFQLHLMKKYKDKDTTDWIIRLTLIPEFIYANMLTVVLIGSYCFLIFNTLTTGLSESGVLGRSSRSLRSFFRLIGYTEGWGTRTS